MKYDDPEFGRAVMEHIRFQDSDEYWLTKLEKALRRCGNVQRL